MELIIGYMIVAAMLARAVAWMFSEKFGEQ